MEPLALSIRQARPKDAAAIARVYIDSWHDTYAGVLSKQLLCSMTEKGQGARWRMAIDRKELVLVAEHEKHGIVAMASAGAVA